MSGAVTATSQPIIPPSSSSSSTSSVYGPPRIIQWRVSSTTSLAFSARASRDRAFSSSYLKLTRHGWSQEFSGNTLRCNSSTAPGGPGPGENESKNVLDAFFLGKALAEALSERIESTVGEFLSTVGRLQAEQQKQVQDFQEEVLERAKRAKEKAAREAMQTQGLIPNSAAAEVSRVGNGVTSSATSSGLNAVAPAVPPTPSESSEQPPTSADIGLPLDVSDED